MYKVITVSREYGSGGRYVAKLVAEKLGIDFYDDELINMLAEKSKFSAGYIKSHEDKHTSSFLYNIATDGVIINNPYGSLSPTDKIFIAQNDLIRELAEKSPCVIVGRQADYILKDRDDVLKTFITCDMENRIKRSVTYYGLEGKDLEKLLRKKDKARAGKYAYYTDFEWGLAKNYAITLNTGLIPVEQCAEIIAHIYKSK